MGRTRSLPAPVHRASAHPDSGPRGASQPARAYPATDASSARNWPRRWPAVQSGPTGNARARPSCPALPHLVTIKRQPLQGDDAGGIVDASVVQGGQRLVEAPDQHANVLALFLQTVHPASTEAVTAAHV